MKTTNRLAVAVCVTGLVAALGTLIFMVLLGMVAVVGLFTPYTLFISAALGVYLAFVGFTLFCLVVTSIGVLIFTLIKRRMPTRVFLGLSIAAAVLNLAALLILTIPLILSLFSPEEGGAILIFAVIAPAISCIADMIGIGLAVAMLHRETRLLRDEGRPAEIR